MPHFPSPGRRRWHQVRNHCASCDRQSLHHSFVLFFYFIRPLVSVALCDLLKWVILAMLSGDELWAFFLDFFKPDKETSNLLFLVLIENVFLICVSILHLEEFVWKIIIISPTVTVEINKNLWNQQSLHQPMSDPTNDHQLQTIIHFLIKERLRCFTKKDKRKRISRNWKKINLGPLSFCAISASLYLFCSSTLPPYLPTPVPSYDFAYFAGLKSCFFSSTRDACFLSSCSQRPYSK